MREWFDAVADPNYRNCLVDFLAGALASIVKLSSGRCLLMIGVRKQPYDGMSVFTGRVN